MILAMNQGKPKILHCQPHNKGDKRSAPPICSKCEAEIKGVPKLGHDELCLKCRNVGKCEHLCLPMQWIDGTTERKEKLLKQPVTDLYDYPDYNSTLHELIRSKQTDHIEDIRNIPDMRIRAIISMLNAHLSITYISTLIKCNRGTIYKWLNIKEM